MTKMMKHILSLTLWLLAIPSLLFAQAGAKPLTNADVIEMTKKGLSVAEITRVINSSQTNFDISYPAMLQLQQAGVDPAIGNLMMNRSVGKAVAAQLGGTTTMDITVPNEIPTTGGPHGQKIQVNLAQAMAMSDDDFKAQQDQAVHLLAEHGCFGPGGPKVVLDGGKTMMCQGVSSNMAPGSSAKISGATTTMSSGFMIGGEHSITAVPASATFTIDLGEVPGASMAEFKPVLVRVASSTSGRIVSHTSMKVVAKFPAVRFETELQDDVVPTEVALDAGRAAAQGTVYAIKPAGALPPGEYGIVLRKGGSPNMRIKDASHDPAMGIVQAVWDFRVAP